MNRTDDTRLKQLMEQAWPIPPQPAGSRERFAQRLAQKRQTSHKHWWWGIGSAVGIAASIIIALFVGQPGAGIQAEEGILTEGINTTIAEVRGYYKSKMWTEAEYIKELAKDMDPEMRRTLLMEVRLLSETPDSIVREIMLEDIDDEQKKYYITSVYMAHLRSLRYMHEALKENNLAYK
ncbi:MAG: hypothetical protein IKT87_04695 [Bacteroidaceae bacterium]|nr:hypothetical protein [Bacteroidaceae bacterium]